MKSFNQELDKENLQSEIVWDGTDTTNRPMPSGVYFVTLQAGDYAATQKLLIIR